MTITDVRSMTQSLVSKWNFSNTVGGASLSGFDVKDKEKPNSI